MFGNTKEIADGVAEGLLEHGAVEVVEVVEVGAAAPSVPDGVDLLGVGGPTHAHGLSRPTTRKGAADDQHAETVAMTTAVGLREWLSKLEPVPGGVAAAAFDTRLDKAEWLTGSAARGAERRLRKLGFRLAAPAESFFVSTAYGPVADGELDRARGWGAALAAAVADRGRVAS
jgi:hypothetical protein